LGLLWLLFESNLFIKPRFDIILPRRAWYRKVLWV
jgi:hypothetical protein